MTFQFTINHFLLNTAMLANSQKFCLFWILQEKVQHLKEEVQLQYQKMQQLLEEDLGKTLEVLDQAHTKFCQENSTQVLQLNQKRQEAKKLLSSIQMVFDKAEDIKFMRVTAFILGYLCF